MSSKPNVLVVGASGNTGHLITIALLQSNQFNVHILVRPASEHKPRITTLKSSGVTLHFGDIATSSIAELESILRTSKTEIIISTVIGDMLQAQKRLFEAAKNVGPDQIKRVVPSDFGIFLPGPEEFSTINEKADIHAYITSINLPYTYIEVGWWMDLIFPYPTTLPADSSPITTALADRARLAAGTGNVKAAFTSRHDIAQFVTRIIADPRTLNKVVFCHGDEVTLNEVYDVANRVSGEDLKATVKLIPGDELEKQVQAAREAYSKERTLRTYVTLLLDECFYYMFVLGENTVAKAVNKHNALDARLLYPDFKPLDIEQFAEVFYKDHLPDIIF